MYRKEDLTVSRHLCIGKRTLLSADLSMRGLTVSRHLCMGKGPLLSADTYVWGALLSASTYVWGRGLTVSRQLCMGKGPFVDGEGGITVSRHLYVCMRKGPLLLADTYVEEGGEPLLSASTHEEGGGDLTVTSHEGGGDNRIHMEAILLICTLLMSTTLTKFLTSPLQSLS